MKENYQWKVLLKTSATEEGENLHVPHPHIRSFPAGQYSHQHLRQFGAEAGQVGGASEDGSTGERTVEEEEDPTNQHMGGYLDHDLFVLAWGPTIAALSFVFDKSEDAGIAQKAVAGFKKCALVAATYGLSDVFDNLVISLCKFTTLMSSSSHAVASAVNNGSNSAESAEGLGLAIYFGNALKASPRGIFLSINQHQHFMRVLSVFVYYLLIFCKIQSLFTHNNLSDDFLF